MATHPIRSHQPAISPDYNENSFDGRDNEVRQGVTGHGVRYVLGFSLAAAVIVMIIVAVFAMRG